MKKIHVFFVVAVLLAAWSCSEEDVGVSFEEQLTIDIGIIEDHLEANNISAEVHSSGIRFVQNIEGDGESPQIGNDIAIKYDTYFLDGTSLGGDTIGNTISLADPIITAWQLMIPEMKEGGEITIYTPSGYAFGPNINGSIPPNTVLVYEVALLAKIDNEDEQLQIDTLIIDEYLQERGLDSEVDPSGIRFRTLAEGTGDTPELTDDVEVIYEGRFLDGVVFDSNQSGIQFPLNNLINAWRIMIPQMKEGGKIEVYAPSRYCYGPSGTQGIPPNAILAFEVELVSVR